MEVRTEIDYAPHLFKNYKKKPKKMKNKDKNKV